MFFETQVEVRANEILGDEIFLLTLHAPEIARAALPGQFVMLQASPSPEPLLRRPMSFCQIGPSGSLATGPETFRILYQVAGFGTRLMTRLVPGDTLSCLGPLGRGFPLLPGGHSRRIVLVAGGIGLAPFPFLAERLRDAGVAWSLLYGARSARQIVGIDWFRQLGVDPILITEDGSVGEKGFVTAPLSRMVEEDGKGIEVYACGPDPMLRAVARVCREGGVPCRLSLEAVMPCGFGVCLGCGVAANRPEGGYLRICTDGPVFSGEEIRF